MAHLETAAEWGGSALSEAQLLLTPKGFFEEAVMSALHQRRVNADRFVQNYLTELLQNFISSQSLFGDEAADGKKIPSTLAELYLTATSIESGVRLDLLKRLGDTSLYISGFFGESLQRKVVDIDYYVNMGGLAYGSLSGAVKVDELRGVYLEFATHFAEYVDVLTVVSQKMLIQTNENLLQLYEKYVRTGSEVARDTLIQKGINPVSTKNEKSLFDQ